MKLLILVLSLTMVSCSTLKKSIIYPSVGGFALGSAGGYFLSDEDKGHSKEGNALIYGVVGSAIGAGLGYLLYKDHPDNNKLNHKMSVERELKGYQSLEREYPELRGKRLDSYFKLPVSTKEIPKNLMDKLKTPTVKIYEIPSKIIEEDGKQIVIDKTKGYEYVLE